MKGMDQWSLVMLHSHLIKDITNKASERIET